MKAGPLFWAGVAFVTIAAAYSRKAQAAPGIAPGALDLFGGLFAPVPDVQAASTDVDALARTIWGEARSEGAAGMQAVANVVMNRRKISARTVTPDWWGETVADICTKSITRNGRTYWQFDAWNTAGPNLARMLSVTPDDPSFSIALDIALRAVRGDLPDITAGATHYYANYISAPDWTEGARFTAQHGRHLFFSNVA